MWDVFAVSTYFTVSLMFWYVGLMPDLATLRDQATTQWKQIIYGIRRHGLARFGAPLAAPSIGVSAAGGLGHAAGALGAQRGQF